MKLWLPMCLCVVLKCSLEQERLCSRVWRYCASDRELIRSKTLQRAKRSIDKRPSDPDTAATTTQTVTTPFRL